MHAVLTCATIGV